MPTVTYRGRWPTKRAPFGTYTRGIPQDVTQEWLESNRRKITNDPDFVVASDANDLVDLNADGEPDKKWTRQQLYDWLTLHDVRARAGLTKAQLLDSVRGTLGMGSQEEVEEAEEPVLTEEVMNETALVENEADSEEAEVTE
tara:strand:+ start:2782 stop:3207 length:426 start_codon:yes stop_codon:yes gene_type:complete